ncbi:hypothetical protein MTR_1g101900 [Medicago truncatula]|uniref:Uncharacterized protein n=1 Tax=Medicago truncatula TaxID=3880 RepID=G7IC29_MEDTR|nr:hypothetical protein MTR_1g101900 [Medicago truncatula]
MEDIRQAKNKVTASFAAEGSTMSRLKEWNDLYGEGGSKEERGEDKSVELDSQVHHTIHDNIDDLPAPAKPIPSLNEKEVQMDVQKDDQFVYSLRTCQIIKHKNNNARIPLPMVHYLTLALITL